MSYFQMPVFTPTRHYNPCPICSDTTGKCRETDHVQLCMTMADALHHIPGFRFIGRTKNDLWGKWVAQKASKQSSFQPVASPRASFLSKKKSKATPLSADERDRHYTHLLENLSLHPDDYADLKRRGLTDEHIQQWGVKSVEPWQSLSSSLPSNLPGVRQNGRSLNIFAEGYVCPIRDVKGRIVACQIRSRSGNSTENGDGNDADSKGIPKYYWLTSKTKKNPLGATAHLTPLLGTEELPLSVYRPAHCIRSAIALVEGTGVKPLLTAERRHIITIGAAGGQFASSPQTLRDTLDELNSVHAVDDSQTSSNPPSPRIIEFYPDAGAISNAHVLRQYRATWSLLQSLGYSVQVMWWNQLTKASPDIDELDDFSRIQTLTVEEFEAIARHPKHFLQQISSLFGLGKKRTKQDKTPAQRQLNPQHKTIHTYAKGDRIQTWKRAIASGYRYILDSSATGTGKSFDTGTLNPSDLAADIDTVESIIYLSDQHRNPTVSTLSETNGWLDLEARHAGLTVEASPNGTHRLRRAQPGDPIHVSANCSRNQTIRSLQEKNIAGAETSALICGFCPLKETCTQAQGDGYGFLKQRRDVLLAEKFRAHPDSLPSPDDYTYENKLVIWDEPGQTFNIRHDIHVTLKDVEQTIAALLKNESIFNAVKPLLAALVPHLDGSAPRTKFGLTHDHVIGLLPDTEHIPLDDVQNLLTADLNYLETLTVSEDHHLASLTASYLEHPLSSLVDTPLTRNVDEAIAHYTAQKVVKNWLPELIKIVQGTQKGALSIQRNRLTISLLNSRHRAVVNAARATVFLDATLSRSDLALKLQCREEDIYETQQIQATHNNLTVIQVTDMGRMGMQRGRQQSQRAQAVIDHYKKIDSQTKVIDFKKNQADGAWWRDSRGVNDFNQVTTLILVGTPCRNLIDQAIEFQLLSEHPTGDATDFAQYVNRVIEADILQAIGRIRHHQRKDEHLTVILISNFETDVAQQKVHASEITENAQTKKEKFITTAFKAMLQLRTRGEKVTQTSVAKLTKYSQQYISRFWKLLQTLLEEFNRTCSNKLTKARFTDSESIHHEQGQGTPKTLLPNTSNPLLYPRRCVGSGVHAQWLEQIYRDLQHAPHNCT
ncbi:MAG: hypothetical protein VKL39_06495 [Leptolyngbyaceae bacterium]|nr:hypothetical protein [Leptolyngbyaceae bacterium]